MSVKWGPNTVSRFLGGQVIFSLEADKSKADYIKNLDGIIARSSDLRPAYLKVGQYLMGATLRTFESEGRPEPWEPLKPATIQDRLRQGFGAGPILVRSGALKRSLTQAGAPFQIFEVGPRSLRYGSKLDRFYYHQLGTIHIPPRVMLRLQVQDRSQISRIINTYVKGQD